jgi:hypothetical protein
MKNVLLTWSMRSILMPQLGNISKVLFCSETNYGKCSSLYSFSHWKLVPIKTKLRFVSSRRSITVVAYLDSQSIFFSYLNVNRDQTIKLPFRWCSAVTVEMLAVRCGGIGGGLGARVSGSVGCWGSRCDRAKSLGELYRVEWLKTSSRTWMNSSEPAFKLRTRLREKKWSISFLRRLLQSVCTKKVILDVFIDEQCIYEKKLTIHSKYFICGDFTIQLVLLTKRDENDSRAFKSPLKTFCHFYLYGNVWSR